MTMIMNSILKQLCIRKRSKYKNPVISVTGTCGKTTTVKIPGIANGIITVKSIFISFDPSKIATSLNDLGILLKAFRIINIPNGTMAIVCNKINAKCLSIKPVLKSNLYSGIIKVTLGIRSGKSRKMKKNSQ